MLGNETILTTFNNGYLTATYKGQALTRSFVDSGTNFYGFTDSTIPLCTGNLKGFYCPTSSLALSAVLSGANGTTNTVNFTLDNANTLVQTPYYALPGIGGDPHAFDSLNAFTSSFDFGLPFFYGKRVYTAIAGRTAGGAVGPYVAF